jgi:hypothetical protein
MALLLVAMTESASTSVAASPCLSLSELPRDKGYPRYRVRDGKHCWYITGRPDVRVTPRHTTKISEAIPTPPTRPNMISPSQRESIKQLILPSETPSPRYIIEDTFNVLATSPDDLDLVWTMETYLREKFTNAGENENWK